MGTKKERAQRPPRLPEDLLLHVFSRLSAREKVAAALVCKRWRKVAFHGTLWAELDLYALEKPGHDPTMPPVPRPTFTGLVKRAGAHLRYLDFGGKGVGAKWLSVVAGSGCKNLEVLSVRLADLPLLNGAVQVAHACPNIRILRLENCRMVTNPVVDIMSKYLPNLEELYLGGSQQITDVGLVSLARRCKKLRVADVHALDGVGEKFLVALGTHCPGLEAVCISMCGAVTDAGIRLLARRCPKLRLLDISHPCGEDCLTDSTLAAIGEHCPRLELLMLNYRHGITLEGLRLVRAGCPELRHLNVRCCKELYFHDDGQLDEEGGVKGALSVFEGTGCEVRAGIDRDDEEEAAEAAGGAAGKGGGQGGDGALDEYLGCADLDAYIREAGIARFWVT